MALYIGSVAAAYFQNAAGDKAFDRFPHGAAPGLEHLAQLKFVGQFFADGNRHAEDIGHQFFLDPCAQRFAFCFFLFHWSGSHHDLLLQLYHTNRGNAMQTVLLPNERDYDICVYFLRDIRTPPV